MIAAPLAQAPQGEHLDHEALQVIPAGAADKPVIANLIQLYLYDMAAQTVFPVGETGRYEYGMLDRFWQYPYLFRVQGQIAGFALVIDHAPISQTPDCWFMAEFFVMRPYRRRGVGQSALRDILGRHPGDWQIGWLSRNKPAAGFWPKAIPGQTQRLAPLAFDGEHWEAVGFTSPISDPPATDRP